MTGWRIALAGVLALPGVAFGHARLVSPPPRSTTIGKTAPCAGIPRTSTPTVLTAGEMLKVDWIETIDHPGHYELAISPADDQNFVTILGNIPDRAFPPGADHNDYTTMLQIPETTCTACTLQLIQFMSEKPPGQQYYYSCADIQIVAATTTTTVPGATTTTSTTATTLPGCDALAGYERATCLITGTTTSPVCGTDPVDARFQTAFDSGLAKVQATLDKAVASTTPPKRARRLLKSADRRLAKLERKGVVAAQRGRIAGGCPQTVATLLEALGAAVAAIS